MFAHQCGVLFERLYFGMHSAVLHLKQFSVKYVLRTDCASQKNAALE